MQNIQEYTFIKMPIYKWKFRYGKNDTMVYMKENAPNIFHRLVQQLILGVIWERIK